MSAEAAPIPIEFRPQPGPQTDFLTTPADIAVYGGAAGGGKSWGILFEGLRHVTKNPRFYGCIFRRQSSQITNPGGLWDEASTMYPQVGGTMKVGDLEYTWEGGGRLVFGHLTHEATKYNHQGSQIPFLGFDELTHFSESQFFYMLSRNRSVCGVKPYVRATTNPDAGSWVKKLLGPWVDRKHKLFPTKPGTILFMVREKGQIVFHKSREEALAANPKARPKTVTFIRASVHDNKKLMEADPDYLANLMALPEVEQRRLLDGDWDVVNEGLVYPEFGSCVVENEDWPEELHGRQVGGIDWGWADPFSAIKATVDVQDVMWVEWLRYERRVTPTVHAKALPVGTPTNGIRWHADPSGASLIGDFRMANHDVVACVHKGSTPIKDGIAIVTQRIREGRLKVKGTLGELIDEAGKYRYPEPGKGDSEVPLDKDNHAMDAMRYMIVGYDRGRVIGESAVVEESEAEAIERERLAAEAEQAERDAYYDVDADHWWDR